MRDRVALIVQSPLCTTTWTFRRESYQESSPSSEMASCSPPSHMYVAKNLLSVPSRDNLRSFSPRIRRRGFDPVTSCWFEEDGSASTAASFLTPMPTKRSDNRPFRIMMTLAPDFQILLARAQPSRCLPNYLAFSELGPPFKGTLPDNAVPPTNCRQGR